MKTKLRVFAGISILLGSVQLGLGSTSFNWFDFGNTVTPGFAVGRTILTYTSTDASVGLATNGTPFLTTYGNDAFYTGTVSIIAADFYLSGNLDQAGDSLVGKFAYVVLVDMPFASFTDLASIPGGTKWGVSAMSPSAIIKIDTDPPGTTQSFNGGNVQIIPEPASVALLLFGVATAVWRRKRMPG